MYDRDFARQEMAAEQQALEEHEANDPVHIAEAEARFEVREQRKEQREQHHGRWSKFLKRITGRGHDTSQ